MLLGRCESGLFVDGGDDREEGGDVAHADCLEGDADAEGAFPADDVDEEEAARGGGDELDDAKDGGGEEFLFCPFVFNSENVS